MIKNDFKYAKLSFVRADARNSSQLVALSKSHNPVIFMTDFVRHASVESVRSAQWQLGLRQRWHEHFARKIAGTLPTAPKAKRPFGAIEESFVCLAIRLPVSSGSEWVVQTIRLHRVC